MANPILVRVKYDGPSNKVIELQGPSLRAYHRWLEDGGTARSEEDLAQAILDQTSDHILRTTGLYDWTYAE